MTLTRRVITLHGYMIGELIDLQNETIKTLEESLLRRIKSIVIGDRDMLNDKIVIEYHEKNDIEYLNTKIHVKCFI
ncbi:hypothetical protein SAMN02745196_00938 [Clostridium collagenovorans DSM 3089]|uniref:Uncharacterized protein n=1 Tax=Clostridium collagenovorans DSM 3089 TaxID=1121306 RepID=A0A1M5UTZ3_9CLOT|nr:hypothetical protein [Clostridium collagenovorans]SHH66441.1 hypothetical protein SAMN02745196_00938 [Clostridium collagenovorans DSM 3089]